MNKIVALLMLLVVALMVVQVQAAPKFRMSNPFKRNAATASGPTRSAASQSSLPSAGQPSAASAAPPPKTGFLNRFQRKPSPATPHTESESRKSASLFKKQKRIFVSYNCFCFQCSRAAISASHQYITFLHLQYANATQQIDQFL
ncbi:hypothetical protein MIR68_006440 [Amoeboaphelidium protococcarum]|nr:hypothetical protein MIR68_006440 [Amoeboaphelidium protococcarum]